MTHTNNIFSCKVRGDMKDYIMYKDYCDKTSPYHNNLPAVQSIVV